MPTPIPVNRVRLGLEEIARITEGSVVGSSVPIVGVVTDSRQVQAGNLYVALRGEQHDGHRFIAEALARGAAAVLVDDRSALPAGALGVAVSDTLYALGSLAAEHRKRWGGRVVAITGSVGKTTTKELTFAALAALGAKVTRSLGNLNNWIGTPMSILCLDAQTDLAVLEVGTSARGELPRLAAITAPDVGVVTAVTLAHTAGLGSLTEVAEEKASLLWALPEDGAAIYRADHPALLEQLGRVRAHTRLSFGHAQDANVRLVRHMLSAAPSMACEFAMEGRRLNCELSCFGGGPALDAAAALAVVLAVFGQDALEQAAASFASLMPARGRLAPLVGPGGSLILDDSYNANPASMRASIETAFELARLRGGRAVLVLGDMRELGAQSQIEHESVGRQAAAAPASTLIACGAEMTRTAEVAREQARRTGHELSISHLSDPGGAGELLAPLLDEHDVVLVKGSLSMGMDRVVERLLANVGGGR